MLLRDTLAVILLHVCVLLKRCLLAVWVDCSSWPIQPVHSQHSRTHLRSPKIQRFAQHEGQVQTCHGKGVLPRYSLPHILEQQALEQMSVLAREVEQALQTMDPSTPEVCAWICSLQ